MFIGELDALRVELGRLQEALREGKGAAERTGKLQGEGEGMSDDYDIPADVIDVLEYVRAGGETNMLDHRAVIKLAIDAAEGEGIKGWRNATWLANMEALKAMGQRADQQAVLAEALGVLARVLAVAEHEITDYEGPDTARHAALTTEWEAITEARLLLARHRPAVKGEAE